MLDASAIATELLLNTQTAKAQAFDHHVNQTVAGLPDGGFVSVWQSGRQDGSGWGIFGQRFDAAGVKVGTEFQANQTTRFNQRGASVAAADDGRFVVTWQSFRQDGSSIGIVARVFAADGSPSSSEFVVNQTTRGVQNNADATFLNDGNIVFTWSGRSGADRHGAVARVFAADGTAVTSEVQVNQFTKGIQHDPAVAADSDGGFWVTWHGRGAGDRNGVFARRFDAAGTPLANEFLVNNVTKRAQSRPTIAASDDGRILVAWQSRRQDGSGLGVFARLYNNDGTTIGTPFQVNQTTRRLQFRPAVAFTSDGGFAVTWTGRGSGDRWGIFLREYNADATPEGNERLVNTTTKGWQARSGIARTTSGFVVTWTGRGAGDRRGVFASLYEETPVTSINLLPITDQTIPELQTLTVNTALQTAAAGTVFSFVGDAPTGAAIDSATGEITWRPTEADGPGTFDFTVRATSSATTDDEAFQVTVSEVNQAPVLASIGNRAAVLGETVSLTATASDTDVPTNTLTFSLAAGAPSGATIDPATGAFSWSVPADNGVGDVSVTVLVADDGNPALTDSETFIISVASAAVAPVLAAIGDQTVDEGNTVTFTAQATDANSPNDTLTFSLGSGAPAGAAINASSGVFAWTTEEADGPSVTNVTVIVTDSTGRTDQETVQVAVGEVNQAPVLASIGDRSVNSGSTVTFTASATDADSPANTLTYSLATGAPSGATIDPNTGAFSWNVPANASTANVSVTVQVTDNGTPTLSDSETITVAVTNTSSIPTVSIGDVSVNEGDGTATLTLTLSAAAGTATSVNVATSAGTALSGADYTETTTLVSFAAGETQKTVNVPILQDLLDEPAETFSVNVSNVSGLTVSDGTAVVTIVDDDPTPTLTINDVSQNEGDSGTTAYTFTVSLSAASGQQVTTDFATADGTAGSSDYQAVTGTLTFAPGETSQTIVVAVNGDTGLEADETFTVNLSSAVNATIGDATGLGTIVNDDTIAAVSAADVTVNEADGTATVTLSLSATVAATTSVQVTTSAGTATAGADYTETTTTVTFIAGETQQTFQIPILQDLLDEADETIMVTLSGAAGLNIDDAQAIVTIEDDDAPPSLSINDVSVFEGDTGMTVLVFTTTLNAVSGQVVTFDFSTADGTAESASDYTASSGTTTIAVGATQQTIIVQVLSDTVAEADETLSLILSNAVNATLSDDTGVGTILNDDALPTIAIGDVTASESAGVLSFPVTLSAAAQQEITVTFATADGSATAGSDYTATTETLTFAAGETQKTIDVAITDDSDDEPDETLFANLTNASNATIADAQGIGTIEDDDAPTVTISISDAAVTEGSSTTGPVAFSVGTLAAGQGTESIVTGRLNEDTFRDVAVANTSADTVSVMMSNGDGTFQTAVSLATGDQPTSIVAVDLTGDGLGALVTANRGDSSLSIFLNSDGTFTASTIALPGVPLSVVAGDFVGDSSLDLAIAVQSTTAGQPASVRILPGNGDGTFGTALTFQGGFDPFLLLAADLNGGGKDELVSVNDSSGMTILSNNGSDVFTATATLTATGNPVSGTVADVNSDSVPDLILITSGATAAHAFVNDGSATFGSAMTTPLDLSVIPDARSVVSGDFNNDTISDIAVVDADRDNVVVLTGTNDGNFTFAASFDVGAAPFGIVADDLNNDGALDLATANFVGNSVTTLFSSRDQTNAAFVITLSAASQQIVTVDYTTVDDSAKDENSDNDYTRRTGSITFQLGETQKTVFVPITDDLSDESLEQFFIDLLNPLNALIFDGRGGAEIIDND